MKSVLAVAAILELVTGVALVLVPSLVAVLLLGEPQTGIAAVVARVAGIALVGLGLACWPGPPRLGMLVYGGGVALLLAWQGLAGSLAGPLLWPAVALHVVLSALLAEGFLREGGGPR